MSKGMMRRVVIVVVVAILALGALLLAARIPRTMTIFLIGAFVAFGAHPLVNRLELRMPRPAAIAVVYCGLLGALVLISVVIIPISYGQILELVQHTPDYVAASQTAIARTEHALRGVVGNRVPLPSTADIQSRAGIWVAGLLAGTIAQVGAIFVGVFSALLIGMSALILSVFFLLQGRDVRDAVLGFVPLARRPKFGALLHELTEVFGHFVAGQALLCTIVGVLIWLCLAPAHFSFALLVALLCGVAYAVPFVGMLVAQIVAAVLAVPQGPGMVLWVTVAIFVIARVADNFLVPKIMARSLGVSPITVMFAVFAGGELFGLPGFILGIPAAALLKVLFDYFVQPYVVRMQQAQDAAFIEAVKVQLDVEMESQIATSPEPPIAATSTPAR
ncbi:MAG: AI-2E family transporter [Candidatus Elarobacter sp.]